MFQDKNHGNTGEAGKTNEVLLFYEIAMILQISPVMFLLS